MELDAAVHDLFLKSQYAEALEMIRAAPPDKLTLDVLIFAAAGLVDQSEFEEAYRYALRAASMDPYSPRALHALFRSEMPRFKKNVLEKLEFLHPESGYTYAAKATLEPDKITAVELARKAHEAAPNTLPVVLTFVYALHEAGLYEAAREQAQFYLASLPKYLPLRTSLVAALEGLKLYQEAEHEVENILEDNPDHKAALQLYGFMQMENAFQRRRPCPDARLSFHVALDALVAARPDGVNDRLSVDIADCLRGLGRYAEALKELEPQRSIASINWKRFGAISYGRALLASDETETAARKFAYEVLPDALDGALYDPRTHHLAAKAFLRLGNEKLAGQFRAFEQSLEKGRELSKSDIDMFFEHIGDLLPQNPKGFR